MVVLITYTRQDGRYSVSLIWDTCEDNKCSSLALAAGRRVAWLRRGHEAGPGPRPDPSLALPRQGQETLEMLFKVPSHKIGAGFLFAPAP
jgi:hypothetical protein